MIRLKHHATQAVKNVPTGFSWTSLLFGPFVPLFRGDTMWVILYIVIAIVLAGIFVFIFPFIYNKLYLKNLLEKGFTPADEKTKQYLKRKGLVI